MELGSKRADAWDGTPSRMPTVAAMTLDWMCMGASVTDLGAEGWFAVTLPPANGLQVESSSKGNTLESGTRIGSGREAARLCGGRQHPGAGVVRKPERGVVVRGRWRREEEDA